MEHTESLETTHEGTESGIAVHLAPEAVGYVFGVPLTNTLLTVWLVMAVLIGVALLLRKRLRLVPSKVQTSAEALVGGGYDYVKEVLESEEYARRFFPLIATIFIFILGINWIGLLPGIDAIGVYHESHGAMKLVPFFHPGNTDLNITFAFAIVAFVSIEIAGVLIVGMAKYSKKFINFSSPLNFIIGIIELLSELARLISFSFRLFGNIFAGKMLLLVALFFVPFVLPVPLMAFELFVGLIQAFIFAILTLFFVKLAIEEPH